MAPSGNVPAPLRARPSSHAGQQPCWICATQRWMFFPSRRVEGGTMETGQVAFVVQYCHQEEIVSRSQQLFGCAPARDWMAGKSAYRGVLWRAVPLEVSESLETQCGLPRPRNVQSLGLSFKVRGSYVPARQSSGARWQPCLDGASGSLLCQDLSGQDAICLSPVP